MNASTIKTSLFVAVLGVVQGVVITNYSGNQENDAFVKKTLTELSVTVSSQAENLASLAKNERETIAALAAFNERIESNTRRVAILEQHEHEARNKG